MNGGARTILTSMQRSLASLPNAVSIGLYTGHLWNYVYIQTNSNDAVCALGLKLGLGAPKRVSTDGRRWLRAELSVKGTQIVVIGPREIATPDT